ncbi:LINE-1 retrotransposable element ORF1 protein [Plecturocebus cupreus]
MTEKRGKRNEQSLQEIWDYVKRPNLRLIGVPEGDEENESKLENTLQDIIQKNFPNLARQANIQVQEIQRTPQRYSSRRETSRHIIVRFTRVEMKEKMLRAAREKVQVTHKGKPIRLTADLSAETLQARREWGPTFNILQEKNFQPRISYLAKLSFISEGKIKFFANKQVLRDYITTRPALQELLKEALHMDGNNQYQPFQKHTKSTLGGQVGRSQDQEFEISLVNMDFGRPRQADHLRSGVQDQPGQHGETPSLLKIQKKKKVSQSCWNAPVIPATQEAETGESQAWETEVANLEKIHPSEPHGWRVRILQRRPVQWLRSVISALWEAEVGGSWDQEIETILGNMACLARDVKRSSERRKLTYVRNLHLHEENKTNKEKISERFILSPRLKFSGIIVAHCILELQGSSSPPASASEKINSICIIHLNVNHKTAKLLEYNTGDSLDGLGCNSDFLNITPKAPSRKEIIDRLDFIKIKNSSVKDNFKRMGREATDWEKIFAKDTSDKGLLSKIYKELLKLNNKKIHNL